jgi:isoamylase
VTAHDGFTLRDLVSYDMKHNEANLEDNRDGDSNNRSWNCGVEGPSDAPAILALRERQQRNFLATLLFSQGVPMLAAGDELCRTQHGNNNAYCQDNEASWVDWSMPTEVRALLEFARRCVALRNAHPLFRRRTFFHGRAEPDPAVKDIHWLHPDGREMSDRDWEQARCLGVFMSGRGLTEHDERGHPIEDDDLLLLLNAHRDDVPFTLPGAPGMRWDAVLDTDSPDGVPARSAFHPGDLYPLRGRSTVLVCAQRAGGAP